MRHLLEEIHRVQSQAELLYSEQEVQAAINHLADDISLLVADSNPLVICVMTGGLLFTGWLLSRLTFPLQLDYVHATRYRGDMAGRELEWRTRPNVCSKDRTVLLVDDIFDEGITLSCISDEYRSQGACRVITAVLVKKCHDRGTAGMQPDFVGLETPDRYIFGCGLDYKNYLRNLPAIYAVADLSTI